MRRFFGILLAFAMLLAICVPFAAAANAHITVEPPDVYPKAGETFNVTVSIENNPGFYSAQFFLTYDKAAMTCTGVKLGEVLAGTMSATNPAHERGAVVGAASASAVKKDGVLATVTFTAKTDVTSWRFSLEDFLLADDHGKTVANTLTLPETQETEQTQTSEQTQTQASEQTQTQTQTQTSTETASGGSTVATAFTDVATGDWYAPWVTKAVDAGLFKGNADGTFHPNDPITRAQYVTVLWRMAGKPEPKAAAPFADVAGESAEFRNAIAWAYENSVVNGTSEAAFSPRGALTREAAMTILYRLNGAKSGMESLMTQIYDDAFADSSAISAWAKPALYWGYYNEIISGTSTTTFFPQGTATRAQIAKILVGYSEKD